MTMMKKQLGQAFALSVVGAAFFNIMPLYLGTAQDHFDLSPDQTGLIGSSFFLGYTLITCLAFFVLPRVSWHVSGVIAVAVATSAIGLTLQAQTLSHLLLAIFLAGAGYSYLYGMGTTIIGSMPNETRNFGWKIALEAVFGAILLTVIPAYILQDYGFEGLNIVLMAAALLLVPLFRHTPSRQVIKKEGSTASTAARIPFWLSLGGLVLFFSGETMAWSFIERVADQHGFDADQVGLVLAISLGFAVAGSLCEAYGAARIGFGRSLIVVSISYILALTSLLNITSEAFFLFVMGACLANFSIGFGLPVLVAICSSHDKAGDHVILTVPAIGIGAVIGPGSAGLLIVHLGYDLMLVVSGVIVAIASGVHILASSSGGDN